MAMTMNKLLILLLSLLAVSLEAATITNWGSQLPTAAPAGGDIILMQKGGVTYYFTPNQLAANIATNAQSGIANKIGNLNGSGTNIAIVGGTFIGSGPGLSNLYSATLIPFTNYINLIADGDSQTRGGPYSGNTWYNYLTNMLAPWLGFTTNAAAAGDGVIDAIGRIPAIQQFTTNGVTNAIYFANVGANDCLFLRDPALTTSNLTHLWTNLIARGFEVIPFTLPFNGFTNATAISPVGAEYCRWIINDFIRTNLITRRFVDADRVVVGDLHKYDLLHYDRASQFALAREVYRVLLSGTNNGYAVDERPAAITFGGYTNGATVMGRVGGFFSFYNTDGSSALSETNTSLYLMETNVVFPNRVLIGPGTNFNSSKLTVYANDSYDKGTISLGAPVYPSIFFASASASANMRNWGIFNALNASGTFEIRVSNAQGGNPGVAGTTKLAINKEGNVGIGTWTPASSLDVTGQVSAASAIITNSVSLLAKLFSAPASTAFTTSFGAHLWSDGTNLCVVLENSAGGRTTNKLSMTAWP